MIYVLLLDGATFPETTTKKTNQKINQAIGNLFNPEIFACITGSTNYLQNGIHHFNGKWKERGLGSLALR
jgi:hypothetical protein